MVFVPCCFQKGVFSVSLVIPKILFRSAKRTETIVNRTEITIFWCCKKRQYCQIIKVKKIKFSDFAGQKRKSKKTKHIKTFQYRVPTSWMEPWENFTSPKKLLMHHNCAFLLPEQQVSYLKCQFINWITNYLQI